MSGDQAYVVAVSSGELGHPTIPPKELAIINEKESKKAAEIEGVTEVRNLGVKDTEIFNTPTLRMTLVNIIRELNPDIVITHWPNDSHPDLRETGQATIDACTYAVVGGIKTKHPVHAVKKVYTFVVPSCPTDFEPEIFVDITEVMERKIEAVKCRKTMIEAFYEGDAQKATKDTYVENAFWGIRSRVEYAEAFREIGLAMHLGKHALSHLPV